MSDKKPEEMPEDFVLDGAARERSIQRKKRPKGSFKKKNSENRLHGKGYIKFISSNLVPPKTLGGRCKGYCRMLGRSCDSISEEDRQQIFDAFHKLPNLELQRHFIFHHVENKSKLSARSGIHSRRAFSNDYFLTIRRKRERVCKKFFISTLAISERMVRTTLQKVTHFGMVEIEQRGGRVDINKQRDLTIRNLVNEHIDRFPRIESHFCRANTDRVFEFRFVDIQNGENVPQR